MFNSVNTLYYKRNTEKKSQNEPGEKCTREKEGKKEEEKMIRYCPSGTV